MVNSSTLSHSGTVARSKTLYMAQLALISAIIVVMAFTPLGYFRTPALSITFLTIPVAVGAIMLGPMAGAFCGGVFGITSIIMAVMSGGFVGMLLQINPLGALFTCFVPRVLEGLVCGLIFLILKKAGAKKSAYFIACLSCPLLNTLFFMSSLVLIFYNTDYIQGFVSNFGVTNPFLFVLAFVGVQGMIEAIACFSIASVVTLALAAAFRRG